MVSEVLKKIYFSDEIVYIQEKLQSIEERLNMLSKEIWEVTTQSSETWHDNAWYDELMRMITMINSQKLAISKLLVNTIVIDHQSNPNRLSIAMGSTVDILMDNTLKTLIIWWFETLPSRVSYRSPLGSALIGKTIGDTFMISINKRQVKIQIIEVR